MHDSIMFIDRLEELARLRRLEKRRGGGLAVIHGRRRVGKTRLLLEWGRGGAGVYFVADESDVGTQRRTFAEAVARRLPGFADVVYPDWRALLSRLAADAVRAKFRGPLVIDELPYLVGRSPELPSVLQQWLDHDAGRAGLVVAVAGSSQRMMQGLVLGAEAPLSGRAVENFTVAPLHPKYLPEALGALDDLALLDAWTAWGGVPRYWELAAGLGGSTASAVDALALDPQGVLHDEVSRLLLEESPPAHELRPLLGAIGAGAHRLSEIAGRLGTQATSLGRPLDRLQGLGLVIRETPFGCSPKDSRRSLYHLADPFFRLWFRVVAFHKSLLAVAGPKQRRDHLERHWAALRAEAFETLCRQLVAGLDEGARWGPAQRWWQGAEPEWDIVAESRDGKTLLLGEARALAKPVTTEVAQREVRALLARQAPRALKHAQHQRVLLVPSVLKGAPRTVDGVTILGLADLLHGDWPGA